MEVILLEKIAHLGGLGDKVRVKNGYGRNYLLPRKKAVMATRENLEKFEQERASYEAAIAARLQQAQEHAEQLTALGPVTIAVKAGDEGRLFGSVGTRDIADALTAAGCSVHRSEVRLPDGVIRSLGEYEIALQLHADVHASVTVVVAAEQ